MFKLILRNIQRTRTRTNYCNLIAYNKLNVHIGVVSMAKEVKIDKEEIRKKLTPVQYHVTQEKGTERPYSGCYNKTYDAGTYVCIVCEQTLFSSDTKYDSGCGWPAFNDVLDQGKVKLSPDTSGVETNLPELDTSKNKNLVTNVCSDSEEEFMDDLIMNKSHQKLRRKTNSQDCSSTDEELKKRKAIDEVDNEPQKRVQYNILEQACSPNVSLDVTNCTILNGTSTSVCSGGYSSSLNCSTEKLSLLASHKGSKLSEPNNDKVCPVTLFGSPNGKNTTSFSSMDFDTWEEDMMEVCEDFDLDLTQPHHCKITNINNLQTKCVLTLISTQNNKKAVCTLEGFWMYTALAVGDTVYITSKNINGNWIVNNHHGLLVFEPDLLVSSTSIVNSLWCKRRSLLSETFRGFDSTNQYMLVGKLIHSILQYVLKNNVSETKRIEEMVRKLIQQKQILKSVYECDISLQWIEDEVMKYIPKIQDFVKIYVNTTNSSGLVKNKDDWKGNIDTINDIEENIWCPELGIKGKIDVTVTSSNQHMPLELKTGKASLSLEHKGQVILYLMMMKKIGYDVISGLLLYLKEGILREISSTRNEERDLIRLRNELVYYINRTPTITDTDKVTLPELPEPINHKSCNNCPYSTICTVFAHFNNEDISSKTTLKKIQQDTLEHLTKSHIDYFIKWTCALLFESKSNAFAKDVKEIFMTDPEDREAKGRCISNLKIVKVSEDLNEVYSEHLFEKIENECTVNLLRSGILEGGYVVISTPKRHAVAAGFVTSITTNSIFVTLERDLNKKYQGQTFCIDSYDSSISQTYNLSSLALLLEHTDKAENLRRAIIDREPPTFKAMLPKIIGTKGKPILRRLNLVQQRAVLKAITANDYFLIKGMPGTGKTATIVALIQLLNELDKTVLITSHTNSAVDNVCLKLIQYGVKLMRLGSESKIHKDLREYSEHYLTKNCNAPADYEAVYTNARILAVTCMASGHPVLTKRSLDVCIVDESTQVLQSSVIRPLYSCKTFILIGDPDQLPAVVKSGTARDLGMSESLFERLYSENATTALNINYRMNSTITSFANSLTYNGELKVGSESIANATMNLSNKQSLKEIYDEDAWIVRALDDSLENAVQFIDTGPVWNLVQDVEWKLHKSFGNYNSQNDNNSKINIHEAAVIFNLVEALLKGGIEPGNIGVIASYRHQVDQITSILKSDCIDVSTVDQFQGKDKSVIIYSSGNSKDAAVFRTPSKDDILGDKRRLTVAITRAKHKLIIVGDIKTLMVYSTFKKLLLCFETNIIKLCESKGFLWENVLRLNN